MQGLQFEPNNDKSLQPNKHFAEKKKSQFELEQTGLAKEALMVKNINYNRRRRNENGSLKLRGCIPYST